MKNKVIIIVVILLVVVIGALVIVKTDFWGNDSNGNVISNDSNQNTTNTNTNNSKKENTLSQNNEANSDNPYIPEGFSYVEGKVDDGYTIEDSYGNQYVWIPVKKGKMKRSNESNSNYEETDNSASELVNSVAQNYGFYVAKYEASNYKLNNKKTIASVKGEKPINNMTFFDAEVLCEDVARIYKYEDCHTAIMNSYAWDTMLDWIDKTNEGYSSSTDCGNYSNEINKTGETESDVKNNICDLAGNLREWTTEIYKSKKSESDEENTSDDSTNETVVKDNSKYRVVRGGSANLERTPSSRNKYKENTSNEYWGFRTILYKK